MVKGISNIGGQAVDRTNGSRRGTPTGAVSSRGDDRSKGVKLAGFVPDTSSEDLKAFAEDTMSFADLLRRIDETDDVERKFTFRTRFLEAIDRRELKSVIIERPDERRTSVPGASFDGVKTVVSLLNSNSCDIDDVANLVAKVALEEDPKAVSMMIISSAVFNASIANPDTFYQNWCELAAKLLKADKYVAPHTEADSSAAGDAAQRSGTNGRQSNSVTRADYSPIKEAYAQSYPDEGSHPTPKEFGELIRRVLPERTVPNAVALRVHAMNMGLGLDTKQYNRGRPRTNSRTVEV